MKGDTADMEKDSSKFPVHSGGSSTRDASSGIWRRPVPKQGVLLSVPKQPLPLRLTVGKDIVSYKRFDAGKPLKIYLRDSQTGKIVATVFAGRKIAEWIALCVNKEGC